MWIEFTQASELCTSKEIIIQIETKVSRMNWTAGSSNHSKRRSLYAIATRWYLLMAESAEREEKVILRIECIKLGGLQRHVSLSNHL